MKKTVVFLLVSLLLLTSCATTRYFAGSVGGVYLTSDDFSDEYSTSEVNNSYSSLKSSLWGFKSGLSSPNETGNKVLFYSDLDDDGFFNELVPDNYRATDIDEAGFVIVAVEGDPVFYSTYGSGSLQCKVYLSTAVLKLYSIKTGKVLYTGTAINGPTPPQQISVYSGTTSLTWDEPEVTSFTSQIKNICSKIASGKINGSIPDEQAMVAAGEKVTSNTSEKEKLSLQGIWTASSGDYTYKLIFTDDYLFIKEEWNDGILSSVEIEEYEFEDLALYIDGDEVEYTFYKKKLGLEILPTELAFTQKSKKAVNTASLKSLYGVWEGGVANNSYLLGITNDGFVIYQGSGSFLGDYYADDEYFAADYSESRYCIIDGVLYFEDYGFFNEYEVLRFERKSSGGNDSTSNSKIISSGDLIYASEDGNSGNVFTFYSSGKFKDVPFDSTTTYSTVTGTYSYSDHVINLSDGRELSIACIDDYYIGFTM